MSFWKNIRDFIAAMSADDQIITKPHTAKPVTEGPKCPYVNLDRLVFPQNRTCGFCGQMSSEPFMPITDGVFSWVCHSPICPSSGRPFINANELKAAYDAANVAEA